MSVFIASENILRRIKSLQDDKDDNSTTLKRSILAYLDQYCRNRKRIKPPKRTPLTDTISPTDEDIPTHIFGNISKEDIDYICKAINDVKIGYSFAELKDTIIDSYIVASSQFYQGETIEELLTGLLKVEQTLLEQCILFGFVGVIKDIHLKLFAADLLEYDILILIQYCRMMYIQMPNIFYLTETFEDDFVFTNSHKLQLVICCLYGKFRFLERVRINLYTYDVLFGDCDNRQLRFNGSLNFYDCPHSDEIIRKGPDYYYARIARVTKKDIMDNFHPQDTLYAIASLQKGSYIHSSAYSHDELTANLITKIFEMKTHDPRCFITPFGAKLAINMPSWEPILNLHEDYHTQYSDIEEYSRRSGIRTYGKKGRKREGNILYHDYVVAQLSDDFFSEQEGYRDYREISDGIYTDEEVLESHDENNELREDVIFYGKRNGTSKYYIYTLSCLANIWNKYERPVMPHNPSHEFSIRSLKRLEYVLQYEITHPDGDYLGEALSNITWPDQYISIPIQLSRYTRRMLISQKKTLNIIANKYDYKIITNMILHIYNTARYLQNWDDDGPITLISQNGFRRDDFGGKHTNFGIQLSRLIFTLENVVPEFMDIRMVRCEIEIPSGVKGIIPNEDSNNGRGIKTDGNIKSTTIIGRDGNSRPATSNDDVKEDHYLEYDLHSDVVTLGKYLHMMYEAYRFGFDRLLKLTPNYLFSTLEKLNRELLGISLLQPITLEAENPHLGLSKIPLSIEINKDPVLLDFLKGEAKEIDPGNLYESAKRIHFVET